MIKIFVEDTELDLFDDEGIQLVQSVKNLRDISTVFTTYTQQFTVPASKRNNQIFQHYYRDDLQTTVSSLKRLDAHITLNGEVFQKGGVQIEGASIVNGVPRDYKLGFYGNVSRMKEYAGEDTLKDLDLSTYNHIYDGTTIIDGFGSETSGSFVGLNGGDLIYPLFSPVRNWVYDSTASSTTNNIAWVDDGTVNGVYYYELKPALKVSKILDAIESKYGVTFSGSFLSSAPFSTLFLWLHNREGYTFEGQDDITSQGVNIRPFPNWTHSLTTTNLTANNTDLNFTTGSYIGTKSWEFTIEFTTLNNPAFLYLYENGVLRQTIKATATATPYVFNTSSIAGNANANIEIKIAKTTANLTMEADYTLSETSGIFAAATSSASGGSGAQSSTTFTETVLVSNLIPDIRIIDFLNGLVKMYNLIITSDDGETFTFQPYSDFYSAGDEIDLSRWLDTREVDVNNIPRYGALEFKFNESDQVLHKQYRQSNGRGYGDLVARFNFDQDDTFSVEPPFDIPFTELLTDEGTGTSFTDFTVYKSIEVNESGEGSSYYGAPVLFYYGENIDISSTSISFVDENDTEIEIVEIPLCETIDSSTQSVSNGLTFSEEINPYLNNKAADNLYSGYWSDFITNTYNQQAKQYRISAYINYGLLSRMSLNSIVLWKGRKYIINQISTDFKTGKTELELITKL